MNKSGFVVMSSKAWEATNSLVDALIEELFSMAEAEEDFAKRFNAIFGENDVFLMGTNQLGDSEIEKLRNAAIAESTKFPFDGSKDANS